MDVSSFQRLTLTTMGLVLVRPLLGPVHEERAPIEDGDGREDGSMQEETEEGRRPLFAKSESQPSSQEMQEHMKTHIPYRSSCAHYIRGRERGMIPQVRRRKRRTKGSFSLRD